MLDNLTIFSHVSKQLPQNVPFPKAKLETIADRTLEPLIFCTYHLTSTCEEPTTVVFSYMLLNNNKQCNASVKWVEQLAHGVIF